ncbi:MAG: hypothetical protein FIB04_03705 [Gammaproteobacteria bacterium]|nr:hypothetical protein [Gammaproteobacteria bacterium]
MSTRLGLALGLALAAAVVVWWLGASRVAIEGGVATSVLAGNALFVLVLARAMLIALATPRAAAIGGYVAGLRVGIPVVSVGWPVVALAWAASDDGLVRTVASEAVLVACAVLAPLVGRGCARVTRQGPLLEAIATAAGVVVACCIWLYATHGT